MKNKIQYLTIWAGVTLLFLGSCQESSDSIFNQTDNPFQILVVPAMPMKGEVTQFQVVGESLEYTSYRWTLTDELGRKLEQCLSSEAQMSCEMDRAGAILVEVSATKKNKADDVSRVSFIVLDPGSIANQPPRLIADIKNALGEVVATYSTDASLNSGSMNVPQGNYVVDFSRSVDDQDAFQSLRFKMNFNNEGWTNVGLTAALSFPSSNIYSVDLRAIDSSDQASTVNFTAYITCDPLIIPPLNLSAVTLSAAADPILNYFNYNVVGIVGGTGDYRVSWDFNGDHIFDSDWALPELTKAYTLYANDRDITLRVWDHACNYFDSVTQSLPFEIPFRDTSGALTSLIDPSYYYLQADIRPHAGSRPDLEHLQNVDFSANYFFGDPDERLRVICDYNKVGVEGGEQNGNPNAYFWIRGWNRYSRPYDPRDHGMLMKLDNILDNNGMVEPGQVEIDTSQARITYASYYTDGGTDTAQVMDYRKVGECTVELEVVNLGEVSGACAQTPDASYAVRIYGRFHCPHLRSSGSVRQSLNVGDEFGAFFCEVAEVDACVGGGGGGGEPPEPI